MGESRRSEAEGSEVKEAEDAKEVKDPRESAWGSGQRDGFCGRNMGNGSSGITGGSIHLHGMVEIGG